MLSNFNACARRAGLLLSALLFCCFNPAFADHTPEAAAAPVKAISGNLAGPSVTKAWARAMPPGAGVASAYLTLLNNGKKEQHVVSLSSPLAQRVEIHEMKMSGSQMQMRQLKDGLRIPAGKTAELTPGGLHVMLIGIKQDFVPGLVVPVQLVMADGATLDLKIPVRDATQESPHDHAHQH